MGWNTIAFQNFNLYESNRTLWVETVGNKGMEQDYGCLYRALLHSSHKLLWTEML